MPLFIINTVNREGATHRRQLEWERILPYVLVCVCMPTIYTRYSAYYATGYIELRFAGALKLIFLYKRKERKKKNGAIELLLRMYMNIKRVRPFTISSDRRRVFIILTLL